MGKKRNQYTKEYKVEAVRLMVEEGRPISELSRELARILHEKEVANPFQAYKIRLNVNSKKGTRRDRLYTHPTRFPRFQTS